MSRGHDPSFPRLHIRPEQGWVNDPNGVCRIDGRYHVFFQYNPAAPVHGDVHWGHVSSVDLLTWDEEPLALRPRPGALDAAGCWSGCVVDDAGVPTAVYTAVRTSAFDAGVLLARSDRTLRTWTQDDAWTVAMPDDPTVAEVRDPMIFGLEGHRYAVQGAGAPGGPPQLLVYGCDDLTAWTCLGPLLTTDDPVAAEVAPAEIWECPNLFPLGDRWVLVLSLWQQRDGKHHLAGVRYLVGDLRVEAEGPRFRASAGGLVDTGPSYYAPQVLLDGGRALLWGWAWEGPERGLDEIAAAGWAGVLSFPRELRLVGERLVGQPAAELIALRRERLPWEPDTGFAAAAFEVETTGPVQLRLAVGPVDSVVAALDGPGRILVDASLVETFPAEAVPCTTRAYPTESSRWVLEADPSRTEVWRLGLR